MKDGTVFTRDFTLMILGQIISLFGNSMLRFALSLYVLDMTGSAAAFGTITAISMIPAIVLSPIGGIAADRISKRNIMVTLDFLTAGVCIVFRYILSARQEIIWIAIIMVLLAVIQSFYQPAVQSSIPLLADEEHLMKANGIVVQIQALANLAGPMLGGICYGFFNLSAILMISAAAFFCSAVMEIFLHIPFYRRKQNDTGGIDIGKDLQRALRFLAYEQPIMLNFLIIMALLNLFLSAMLIVGLPYIVNITLGLDAWLYGIAEGTMGMGTIVGGLAIGFISDYISFKKSYCFIAASSVLLLPIAVVLCLDTSAMTAYTIILISIFSFMLLIGIFNIFAQTFMQQIVPEDMLGKISAFVTMIAMCSLPIGQAFYGIVFDVFHNQIYLIILFGAMMEFLLAWQTRKALHNLEEAQKYR